MAREKIQACRKEQTLISGELKKPIGPGRISRQLRKISGLFKKTVQQGHSE